MRRVGILLPLEHAQGATTEVARLVPRGVVEGESQLRESRVGAVRAGGDELVLHVRNPRRASVLTRAREQGSLHGERLVGQRRGTTQHDGRHLRIGDVEGHAEAAHEHDGAAPLERGRKRVGQVQVVAPAAACGDALHVRRGDERPVAGSGGTVVAVVDAHEEVSRRGDELVALAHADHGRRRRRRGDEDEGHGRFRRGGGARVAQAAKKAHPRRRDVPDAEAHASERSGGVGGTLEHMSGEAGHVV